MTKLISFIVNSCQQSPYIIHKEHVSRLGFYCGVIVSWIKSIAYVNEDCKFPESEGEYLEKFLQSIPLIHISKCV